MFSVLTALAKNIAILLIEALEISAVKRLANFSGKIVVEIEVVSNGKSHTERLLCLYKMTNVRAAVIATSGTSAVFVEWSWVLSILLVEKVHLSVPGKEVSVSCVTAGHYAIKEVNAHVNCLENVTGCSDAHKVSRLIFGHVRLNGVDNAVHLLGLLTDRKSTDSISVTVNLLDSLHISHTKVVVGSTLVNTEKELMRINSSLLCIQPVHLFPASLKPANSSLLRCFNVLIGRWIFYAFVKCHSYG